jgi:hypothetical protein
MKITRTSSNTERPTGTTCEHLTMATEVKTVAPKTMTAGASLKAVLIVLVGLASLLLVICVAAAVVPVHVPREGDGVSYECSPIGGGPGPDSGGSDCARRVQGRLIVATLAGFGAGLLALTALGVQVGAHRAAEDS